VGFKYNTHDDNPSAYAGGYDAWLLGILEMCERLCSPGAPIFVWQSGVHMRQLSARFPREWRLFVAAKNFVQMRPTPMQYAFDPVVVWWIDGERPWSEGTANRDFHIANTAPVIGQSTSIERGHPCPRPVDQVCHIVGQWVKPTSITLDPFMGSGTTGIACIRTGRRFIGIEKDEHYFRIAKERIQRELQQQLLPL